MSAIAMRRKFFKFVIDVISYALHLAGLPWTPWFQLSGEPRSFVPEFARDLYWYRCFLSDQFTGYMQAIPLVTLWDHQPLLQLMANAVTQIFEVTPNPFRGALRYMAFLVDICLYLYGCCVPEAINSILRRIGDVFDTFLRQVFRNDRVFRTLFKVLSKVKEKLLKPMPQSCAIAAKKKK